MIRKILFLALFLELCFVCFMGGRFYNVYQDHQVADKCYQQLDFNPNLSKYYKHDVDFGSLYPHYEGYMYREYYNCINREK